LLLQGGLPFLGHGLLQFTNPRGQAYLDMANSVPNQGLIHFRGFMNVNHVLVVSNEALSEVLVRRAYSFTKPAVSRRLMSRILGPSLLILEGDEHKYLRKRIQPAFNHRTVQDLCPVFWSKAIDMVETMERSTASADAKHTVVDILPWGNKGTLDAIGLAALGKDFDTLRQPNELTELYELLTGSKESVRHLFIANAFLPAWMLQLLPRKFNRDLDDARNKLRQLCFAFVEERKKEVAEGTGQKALLLQLIQGGTLTDDELVGQLLTIIGAGYVVNVHRWTIGTAANSQADTSLPQQLLPGLCGYLPSTPPGKIGSVPKFANTFPTAFSTTMQKGSATLQLSIPFPS